MCLTYYICVQIRVVRCTYIRHTGIVWVAQVVVERKTEEMVLWEGHVIVDVMQAHT